MIRMNNNNNDKVQSQTPDTVFSRFPSFADLDMKFSLWRFILFGPLLG